MRMRAMMTGMPMAAVSRRWRSMPALRRVAVGGGLAVAVTAVSGGVAVRFFGQERAKAAGAAAVGQESVVYVLDVEVRPVDGREAEFRVRALPEQEVGDSHL